MSWCKIEFSVNDPKNVNPFAETDQNAPKDTPPLTMMSIAVRTIVNHRENKTELLCATTRTWEGCEWSYTLSGHSAEVQVISTIPPLLTACRLPSTQSSGR